MTITIETVQNSLYTYKQELNLPALEEWYIMPKMVPSNPTIACLNYNYSKDTTVRLFIDETAGIMHAYVETNGNGVDISVPVIGNPDVGLSYTNIFTNHINSL